MSEFHFRELDTEGRETLDVVAQAGKFNKWMYQTIRQDCQGRILEIGSGIGNISRFFLEEKADITLSDIRANYCEVLREKFPAARDIVQLDLTHPDFDVIYAQFLNQFDSVFALNVIEHIKDHNLAIKNCFELLKPGGKIVILVPAYQFLYNQFDKELEHFRRYKRHQLNEIMTSNGFMVSRSQYFNLMGIPGWFISGKLQKNKTIPKSQMKLYNLLVPIFRLVDKIVFNQAGLSVISVGQKMRP